MNAALAAQQRAFVDALFAPTHGAAVARLAPSNAIEPVAGWERGLLAYRSTGLALAERALAGAYPVMGQLLGASNFEPLARALWQAHPPARGDVAQWGWHLAEFIEAIEDLRRQEPYLPDVARVEWLLHRAATAPDESSDVASLALLAELHPAQVRLVLAPGASHVESAWPVATIVLAHLEGTPTFAEAAARLRESAAESAVVWRDGLKPRVRAALPDEPQFLSLLQERRTLADSLQAAPTLDFAAWLPLAVQGGLLLRAEPI